MKLFLGCEDTKTPLHTGENRVLSEVLLAPEGGNEGNITKSLPMTSKYNAFP